MRQTHDVDLVVPFQLLHSTLELISTLLGYGMRDRRLDHAGQVFLRWAAFSGFCGRKRSRREVSALHYEQTLRSKGERSTYETL